MIPHTGAILRTPAADEHDAVLLDVVALAGDVGGDDGAGGQLNTGRLALARVGLLGAHHAHAQAHALERRAARVGERRRDGVARALALADAAEDLVQRRRAGGCRREAAEGGHGESGRCGDGGGDRPAGRGGEEVAEDGADHGGRGRTRGRIERCGRSCSRA